MLDRFDKSDYMILKVGILCSIVCVATLLCCTGCSAVDNTLSSVSVKGVAQSRINSSLKMVEPITKNASGVSRGGSSRVVRNDVDEEIDNYLDEEQFHEADSIKRLEAQIIKRKEIADKEIEDSLSNGFLSETYYDGVSFMLFKVYSDTPSFNCFFGSDTTLGTSSDSNISLYKSMAEEAKADIIVVCYTSDGFLYQAYYYQYSGSTEDSLSLSAAVAFNLSLAAKQYAIEHRFEYLEAFVANEKSEMWPNVEYAVYGDEVIVYYYAQYSGSGVHWSGSPREVETAQREWYSCARNISRFTNADVTIRFYSSDGIPFANGSEISYVRPSSSTAS